MPTLAEFPEASRHARSLSSPPSYLYDNSEESTARPDEALHNILRAMLALSYEAAPLAAMVEEGVTARLARLASAGPPAIAALLAAGAAATPPLPPPEQASEGVRSPLITACGLLTNIVTSAGHLAWPERSTALSRGTGGGTNKCSPPRAPSHPVLAHPGMGECLASLAEVAGAAGAARRAGGGARWRLLAAHATLVVMNVARSAAPGNGLAPARGVADRKARWDVGSDGDGGDARGARRAAGGGGVRGSSVWEGMARAVDEALGSLSAVPGVGLVGRMGDDEEASYEEGSIWQWCLECAREMEAAGGGSGENLYVSSGVVPRRVLQSLMEASADGRI